MSSCIHIVDRFLIGFMAVASPVAALAEQLPDYQVIDTDQAIEELEGCSIADLFVQKGERYFRDCETHFLKSIEPTARQIISCGGGMILRAENRRIMGELGPVIWLTATPETILDRTEENNERPLLRGKRSVEAIQMMLDERRPQYEAVALHKVPTDGLTPQMIAKQIRGML